MQDFFFFFNSDGHQEYGNDLLMFHFFFSPPQVANTASCNGGCSGGERLIITFHPSSIDFDCPCITATPSDQVHDSPGLKRRLFNSFKVKSLASCRLSKDRSKKLHLCHLVFFHPPLPVSLLLAPTYKKKPAQMHDAVF